MSLPAALPPVLVAEVLLLERGAVGFPAALKIQETRGFEGETAQQLASLWRLLTGKHWMRCHLPSYGMRFFGEAGALLEASVCWECNNINLYFPDGSTGFCAFEASAAPAQELLALCKALLPRSPELRALPPEQCRRVEDALEGRPGAIEHLNTSAELHAFVTAESIARPQHMAALWHIIRHPQCARGTALWVFWHSEPLFWLSHFASVSEIERAPTRLANIRDEARSRVPLLLEIQERALAGFYTRDTVAVDPAALVKELDSPSLKISIAPVLRQPVFGDKARL